MEHFRFWVIITNGMYPYVGDKPRSLEVPRRESRSEINIFIFPHILVAKTGQRTPNERKLIRAGPSGRESEEGKPSPSELGFGSFGGLGGLLFGDGIYTPRGQRGLGGFKL